MIELSIFLNCGSIVCVNVTDSIADTIQKDWLSHKDSHTILTYPTEEDCGFMFVQFSNVIAIEGHKQYKDKKIRVI